MPVRHWSTVPPYSGPSTHARKRTGCSSSTDPPASCWRWHMACKPARTFRWTGRSDRLASSGCTVILSWARTPKARQLRRGDPGATLVVARSTLTRPPRCAVALASGCKGCVHGDGTPQGRPLRSLAVLWLQCGHSTRIRRTPAESQAATRRSTTLRRSARTRLASSPIRACSSSMDPDKSSAATSSRFPACRTQ